MSNGPTTLLLGCGYTLSAVATMLGCDAAICTTRSDRSAAKLRDLGFACEVFDVTRGSGDASKNPASQLTAILHRYPTIRTIIDGIPPFVDPDDQNFALQGPRAVLHAIAALAPREYPIHIVYLSTTGVYGERNGGIVTEHTTPQPREIHADARRRCEEMYVANHSSVTVLRVAGIYGPGRSILDRLLSGSYRTVAGTDRFTNRIHVADLATAITRITTRTTSLNELPPIINLCDGEWLRSSELLALCATYASFSPPPAIPPELAHHTMLSHQRVDGSLLRATLLPELQFSGIRKFLDRVSQNS
jgi:nucleoside-diphosphate-sugar epimerase